MMSVYCAPWVSCRWTQQRTESDSMRRTYSASRLLGGINTRQGQCGMRHSLLDLTHE